MRLINCQLPGFQLLRSAQQTVQQRVPTSIPCYARLASAHGQLKCTLSLCLSPAELKKQLLSRKLVNSSDIMGGTHCLAPACIRASLASSLAKLRIETLDLLYLHNAAEVQLEARGKAGFFEVLQTAFKVCRRREWNTVEEGAHAWAS